MVQRLLLPLLRDSHTHPLLYAAFLDGIDLGANPTETREQAIARIRAAAEPGGAGWTIAYGWNSGRYPLFQKDFDDLPPLVVLNLSLHGLIVNAAGLAVLAERDPAIAGKLSNQAWVEQNLRSILNVFVRGGGTPQRLRRFFDWLLAEHGVYHAEEMLLADEQEIRLFEEAGLADRTRFWAAPEDYDKFPVSLRKKIHGVKLFADGALGTWSAALHQPYRNSTDCGLLMNEQSDLNRMLDRYFAAEVPVAVHAIGDRALEQVVRAAEALGGPCCEMRVEHAQFISHGIAKRAKAMGIRLCMQPNFSGDSIHYADRLPAGYPQRNNPFRMLIDHVGYVPGEDLLLGSDGMPHGFREALRQSLFAPCLGQTLTLKEFAAGYCSPDLEAGHIEVEIDHENRLVSGQVVLRKADAAIGVKAT